MTSSPPLLTISDLHLDYVSDGGPHKVLTGVNLEIKSGESLALIGESGSGKSITAMSIMGLLGYAALFRSGEIIFQGESIHNKTQKEMQRIRGKQIAMIFQDPMTSLNPTLSVGWQIAETVAYHENCSFKNAKQRAIELLEMVEISHPKARYNDYPFQLSGGMRQRVMIAIALAGRPKLLIADEPTTALDATIEGHILDLIVRLRETTGMALLLITHNLKVARRTCDKAVVMQHGKIVEEGLIQSLFIDAQHPYTQTLIDAWKGANFL